MAEPTVSTKPDFTERLLNRLVRILIGLGIGPDYMYMLEVVGRRSGRTYSTPVDLMEIDANQYIVAPRGATQWVRNARAAGEVTLRRGKRSRTCRIIELRDSVKAPLLKEYLVRYQAAVQPFFPVSPDSDLAEFEALGPRYPVFQVER